MAQHTLKTAEFEKDIAWDDHETAEHQLSSLRARYEGTKVLMGTLKSKIAEANTFVLTPGEGMSQVRGPLEQPPTLSLFSPPSTQRSLTLPATSPSLLPLLPLPPFGDSILVAQLSKLVDGMGEEAALNSSVMKREVQRQQNAGRAEEDQRQEDRDAKHAADMRRAKEKAEALFGAMNACMA